MSDVEVDIPTQGEQPGAQISFLPPEPRRRWWQGGRSRLPHGNGNGNGYERPPRPRVRKLRLLLILTGLGALALVSTVFGMMMAVASDLPQIENITQYKKSANSYLYDVQGRPIGAFSAPDHEVIDSWPQISQGMIHAVVSVEDKRFWTDPGVDIRGIGRALLADVTGSATQGASTIAEQFVKNVLSQENNRTILEKLREAALAFQLTRRWPRMRIITQYLNTIYFGNGAYGIESAARVYFGKAHGYDAAAGPNQPVGACGDATVADKTRPSCASVLRPWESALLAGMIANPSAFDPFNPATKAAARGRRNEVLQLMYQQGYLSRATYNYSRAQPLPTSADLQQPAEPPAAPYFTSWLRPQIIAAVERAYHVPQKIAEYRAFYGGLKIKTTLDVQLQQAAQQAVDSEFPAGSNGPTAAIVSIDNRTGEVRAMVSGASGTWNNSQFNLAADSQRQPGSAFKVFTLAEALRTGEYGPSSVIDSAPQDFIVPNSGGKEHFIVHNFGNTYSGPITLQEATSISDNTVFSQVGIHVGTSRIARLAKQMGIRTPVSHNDAMILGGLSTGVSPLDMAHAYETIAEGGRRVYNPVLGDMQGGAGPTGIASITCTSTACGHPGQTITDHPTYKRVLPQWVATTEHSMLEGPVSPGGTAPLAAIPGVVVAGKTGTTSNYVDAWFVGWTPQLTTAVWVGYPNKAVPMLTTYNGSPVEGGTYPAIIWNSFMTNALQILANEQAAANQGKSGTTSTSSTASGSGSSSSGNPTATATGGTNTPAPANGTNNGNGTGGAGGGTGAGTGAGTGGGTGAGTGGGTGGGTGAGTGGGTGGGTGAGTGGGGGGTGGGGGGTGGGTGGTGGGSGGAGLGGAPSG